MNSTGLNSLHPKNNFHWNSYVVSFFKELPWFSINISLILWKRPKESTLQKILFIMSFWIFMPNEGLQVVAKPSYWTTILMRYLKLWSKIVRGISFWCFPKVNLGKTLSPCLNTILYTLRFTTYSSWMKIWKKDWSIS